MWLKFSFCFQFLLHLLSHTNGFAFSPVSFCRAAAGFQDGRILMQMVHNANDSESSSTALQEAIDNEKVTAAAAKFQITTCLSPACSKKRKDAGLDPLSTFAAMYERSKQAGAGDDEDLFVHVEEGPCMGACQFGPCVAIEHAEFDGSVALEGMTEPEFADRVFQNILTEEDADRIWESVENAVQIMAEEEE